MDDVTTTVAWNSTEAIQAAIQQYQEQARGVKAHYDSLQTQVAEAVDAAKLLQGAIAALEQLLANGKDNQG